MCTAANIHGDRFRFFRLESLLGCRQLILPRGQVVELKVSARIRLDLPFLILCEIQQRDLDTGDHGAG